MKIPKRKPVIFNDVSEKTLILAAEIIDRQSKIGFYISESIQVVKKTKKEKLKRKLMVYIKIRRFSEHDPDILFLKEKFGGYYSVYVLPDGKVAHWLSFQQSRCLKLMNLIIPYLTVRRDTIEAILLYYQVKKQNNFRRLTDDAKQEREEIYSRYKESQRMYFLTFPEFPAN